MSDAPVIEFLQQLRAETGLDVVTKVPIDRPDLFVRVDFGSGKAVTPASEERLTAVQVYGEDYDEVVELIYALRMYLRERVYTQSPKILWWEEQAGPHEWADPDIPAVTRWQITGNLTLTLT